MEPAICQWPENPARCGQVGLLLFDPKDCSAHEAERHRENPCPLYGFSATFNSQDKTPKPQRGNDPSSPGIQMARVSSRVDSEAGAIFTSQSTWRTSGLTKVTWPVNPYFLTFVKAHSPPIQGSTKVAVLRSGWISQVW